MSKINISYAATQDWFKYTIISIFSLLLNSKDADSYHFYILSDKFSKQDKNDFLMLNKIKKSEFTFIKMDNSEYKNIFKNPLGNATNYRLKLASITNEDKILYLDSDTLVLGDISELYNTNIENYYIAGIEDKNSTSMHDRITIYDNEFKFINAGVVLMNLNQFRKNNFESEAFKYLEEMCDSGYCDQDAINAVCINKIKYLPIKYNLMVGNYMTTSYSQKEYDEAMNEPLILHFVYKPWNDKKLLFSSTVEWLKYKEKFEKFTKEAN